MSGALQVYAGMFGFNGISVAQSLESLTAQWATLTSLLGISYSGFFPNLLVGDWNAGIMLIALLLPVAWLFPNTQQFMIRYTPALEVYPGEFEVHANKRLPVWQPTVFYAIGFALMAVTVLFYLSSPSEFLYFQF